MPGKLTAKRSSGPYLHRKKRSIINKSPNNSNIGGVGSQANFDLPSARDPSPEGRAKHTPIPLHHYYENEGS